MFKREKFKPYGETPKTRRPLSEALVAALVVTHLLSADKHSFGIPYQGEK